MLDKIKYILLEKGYKLENGLTKEEINIIENKYNFKFPPDLKELLSNFVPIGKGFYNWREDEEKIKDILEWPLIGVIYDVENNVFWFNDWGIKDIELSKNIETIKLYFSKLPKLIPIYSHRYIPAMEIEDLPVISVYQTDVIYYGYNLYDYFLNEFGDKNNELNYSMIKQKIPFWSEVIENYEI